ncbi:MAG TPA: Fe-S protein assembly co-chaperone HscB [Chitinophagaceae bacterium]|nr:Fe-S protein assembly co-chaperone HscB [Chitinophagaceae bacterium]
MNYFELYGIPVQLNPDQVYVKQKYYELSRRYHPDFYSAASPEQQADNLRISSDVNRAYKTFQDQDAIIRYVLQLKELLEDEEKYALAPEFLMEVLEINEALMDVEENDEAQVAALKTKVNELQDEIYKPVQPIVEGYVEGVTSTEELLQVKDYYYKKKYLQRILDKIGGISNIAAR